MQNYFTGYSVSAQATAYAGPMPLREEGILPRVFFQTARNLGTSAKSMLSRVRTANPLKANSEEQRDASQMSECSAEADFREDLRHFLDPKPGRRTSERDN